jgi:nucleotide-binding universal stress UspA family protein
VGIAVDGSVCSNAAVKYVLRHAPLFGIEPRFALIHVAREGAPRLRSLLADLAGAGTVEPSQAPYPQAHEHAFRTPLRLFARAGRVAQTVALTGDPGQALVEYAERECDLLVLGSHGHGLFSAAVLGSTALRVASHCRVPLLLIRRP